MRLKSLYLTLIVAALLTACDSSSPAPSPTAIVPATPTVEPSGQQTVATMMSGTIPLPGCDLNCTTATAATPADTIPPPDSGFTCEVRPLPPTAVPPPGSTSTPELVATQFGLQEGTVRFIRGMGTNRDLTMPVELALTDEQQRVGMMGRTEYPDERGMLFDFVEPITGNFWMRNTPLPLAIAFADVNGTIINIQEMQPFDDINFKGPGDQPYRHALEANTGYFDRHCVVVGDKIVVELAMWGCACG